jgi:hypothetical protein
MANAQIVPAVVDQDIFAALLPPEMRKQLTPELMRDISNVKEDVQILESYRDNIIGHTSILRGSAYTLKDYSKACRYVTYILLGELQKTAYMRTFPDRYREFKAKGLNDKQISARTSMYAKGKLVVQIREAAEAPVWLVNAHINQKAINKQAWLMEHAESERVQSDAANSILTHLKRPEKIKLEVENTEKPGSIISEVMGAAERIIQMQQKQLEKGMTAKQIIDADVVEVI